MKDYAQKDYRNHTPTEHKIIYVIIFAWSIGESLIEQLIG